MDAGGWRAEGGGRGRIVRAEGGGASEVIAGGHGGESEERGRREERGGRRPVRCRFRASESSPAPATHPRPHLRHWPQRAYTNFRVIGNFYCGRGGRKGGGRAPGTGTCLAGR
eukprot:2978133-Rhodomonas_salina.1